MSRSLYLAWVCKGKFAVQDKWCYRSGEYIIIRRDNKPDNTYFCQELGEVESVISVRDIVLTELGLRESKLKSLSRATGTSMSKRGDFKDTEENPKRRKK